MTTAPNEHIDDIVDLYALGALEPADEDRVDEHIRACQRCQALLNEASRVVAALAWEPEQHEPPAELRARVMARAQQVRPASSASAPSPSAAVPAWWRRVLRPSSESRMPVRMWQTVSAAALVLLLALLGNTVRLQRQVQAIQNQAGAQQQLLEKQVQQFQAQVSTQQELLTALRAPGSRVIAFSGTGAGRSQLLINTSGNQAYVLTDGLPVLPSDKAYQVWLLRDQQAVASSVFSVDQQGIATVRVQAPAQLKEYQAAAITVEPAGGSTTPTTKPFLLTQF